MNGEELKTEEVQVAQKVTSTNKNKTKPRKDPRRCLINVRTTVRKTVRRKLKHHHSDALR